MFNFLRKDKCDNCGRWLRNYKLVEFAQYKLCSKECISKFFDQFTLEQLITLEMEDREINHKNRGK